MLQLRQIRLQRGLSVPALSAQSGIPVRTIEDMERRGDCRLSTAYIISRALHIPLDSLWKDASAQ